MKGIKNGYLYNVIYSIKSYNLVVAIKAKASQGDVG